MHTESPEVQYALEAEWLASSILYVSNGIEFPRRYVGPMFFADKMGLDNANTRIGKYHDIYGRGWEPLLPLKVYRNATKSYQI